MSAIKLKTLVDKSKTMTAPEEIFGQELNQALISQAVRVYLSNQRQGTAKTKTRSEINRTHKKWFKQKGTGNARHGARNANIFVGGGVSHGPTGEQNFARQLNIKMKRKALASALSWQVAVMTVADEIAQLDGKTKTAAKLLAPVLTKDNRVLVVVDKITPEIRRSCNNIEQVLVVSATRLNALLVVQADQIVLTSEAIKILTDRLSSQKEKVTVKKETVTAKK